MPKTVGYSQAEVVCEIVKQYIPADSLVLDCTYEKGSFWDSLLTPGLRLVKSDLQRWYGIDVQADFTRLPFRDGVFTAVFFDPPYRRPPGKGRETLVKHFIASNIEYLYTAGTLEIWRVLRPQGLLVVKCGGSLPQLVPLVQSLQLLYKLEHEFVLVKTSSNFQAPGTLQSYHAYFVVMRKRGKATATKCQPQDIGVRNNGPQERFRLTNQSE